MASETLNLALNEGTNVEVKPMLNFWKMMNTKTTEYLSITNFGAWSEMDKATGSDSVEGDDGN